MVLSANLGAQEITPGKEVDLGLPSGTIWAGWNIGATSPEQVGDYFAWGEIAPKKSYTKENYKYYDGSNERYISICGDKISHSSKENVAFQKWGEEWDLPSEKQIKELCKKCKWIRITYKGVQGCKVIGPNGNSIFLPAAGYRYGSSVKEKGEDGYYWTSREGWSPELYITPETAVTLSFGLNYKNKLEKNRRDNVKRFNGLPVRAVKFIKKKK